MARSDFFEGSIIYNPDKIGEFLFYIMPERDFQNYELWRILNLEINLHLEIEGEENDK